MAVTVRPAVWSDIPELLAMGRRFYDASGYSVLGEFDADTLTEVFTTLMSKGCLIVADDGPLVGMLGAVVNPVLFNREHSVCQELFWWVDPAYRGNGAGRGLIEALEAFAAERQCVAIFMASLAHMPGASEFYNGHGFACSEQTFFKALH